MNQVRDESFSPSVSPLSSQWERLKQSGLKAEVTTNEIYEQKVLEGMRDLRNLIELYPELNLTANDARSFHKVVFQTVHPWAGEYRGPGQLVGFGNIMGCHPSRIPREMEMWAEQTKELVGAANSPEEKLAAIAFSHARFERIHPFRDGNGRTGRALMHNQLETVFGSKDRSRLERREYIDGLKHAEHGDLTKLVQVLAKRECIELPAQSIYLSAYRLAPFPPEQQKYTLQDEMSKSQLNQKMMNMVLKGLSTSSGLSQSQAI